MQIKRKKNAKIFFAPFRDAFIGGVSSAHGEEFGQKIFAHSTTAPYFTPIYAISSQNTDKIGGIVYNLGERPPPTSLLQYYKITIPCERILCHNII